MEDAIALITCVPYELGCAAARWPAAEGYREVIDSGGSRMARTQEAFAQGGAQTKERCSYRWSWI